MTNCYGGVPQKLHETEGLDTTILADRLRAGGHTTGILDHGALAMLGPDDLRDAVILYASAQYPEYYQYIENCLLHALNCGAHLLPNYTCFRAHENKFFQELVKRRLGLPGPVSRVYGTLEEVARDRESLVFPLVLKYAQGYGSAGVSRIDSADELFAELDRNLTPTVPTSGTFIQNFMDRGLFQQRLADYSGRYPLKARRIVLQELIPGLGHDWKVLIFGELAFCIKRFVRPNDFRASGSGNFTFDATPDDGLLDFAASMREKLDTPWASFDIVEADGRYYLLEFQCVHFGLYTLLRNPRCFQRVDGAWRPRDVVDPTPEIFFCDAALTYLADRFRGDSRPTPAAI